MPLTETSLPPPERADVFQPLAKGGQSRLFASDSLVIKTPRRSMKRILTRIIVPKTWKPLAQENAGDLLLPWTPIDRVKPAGVDGIPDPADLPEGSEWAPRLPREAFLHRRFYRSANADCIPLLRAQCALLNHLHDRGFVMLDFIMANFAFQGPRLLITDPDLIVPAGKLWQPSLFLTATIFRRLLSRDYQRLIRHKAARARNPQDRDALLRFAGEYPRLLPGGRSHR